jgi:glycosyltransferase involved in cell wall biosynthesis
MAVVSVVIPSYNHASFIGQAIDSVIAQTYEDWELCVVDDGSKDNSLDIIYGYKDPRIKVISQENKGAHAAINKGISHSNGEYISILNSDDVYRQDRFEKLLSVFNSKTDIVLVSSYIQLVDTYGKKLGIKRGYRNLEPWLLDRQDLSFRSWDDAKVPLYTENYLSTTSNFFIPTSVLEKMGGFRPLRFAHDWDFALRLLPFGEIFLYPEPLLKYRVHSANTIRSNHTQMVFEICWCLAVHLPNLIPALDAVNDDESAAWIQALLHSIYTYGAEQVLSTMLLQNLSEHIPTALALLEHNNLTRRMYLDYLEARLTSQPRADTSFMSRFISRLRDFLSR